MQFPCQRRCTCTVLARSFILCISVFTKYFFINLSFEPFYTFGGVLWWPLAIRLFWGFNYRLIVKFDIIKFKFLSSNIKSAFLLHFTILKGTLYFHVILLKAVILCMLENIKILLWTSFFPVSSQWTSFGHYEIYIGKTAEHVRNSRVLQTRR